MKCPQCQNITSDTALLECVHCGSVFERGPREELQHINYLEEWIASHQAQLEEAIPGLLEEVQAQRSALHDELGLRAIDYEQVSRELALVQAVYNRIPEWGKGTVLKEGVILYLQDCLKQRAGELQAMLRGRPLPAGAPAEVEVLDIALEALPKWIQK